MDKMLAKIIRDNQESLLRKWEQKILEQIPVYRGKPANQLRSNMKAGFLSLLEFIETGKNTSLSKALRTTANVRLSENISIGEILRAILLAKSVVVEGISEHLSAEQQVEALLKLESFFIEAVAQFAEMFQEMRKELKYYKNIVGKEFQFSNIIGKSKKMRDIFALIPLIADTTATVLIDGKSGTGKELIAKAIHFNSMRRNNNFVAINCSALPETLLESEMFGYVKGAFTGATQDRDGLFREAEGGTVFLDEVADMSLPLQAKLLRVLQEKEYKRVGDTKTIKADVRLIAATNKDLRKEIASGRFREDLYYRINVISIHLPELKERKEDIPLLVQHFMEKFNRESNRNVNKISSEAMKALIDHNWQGNVRELENVIERAVILCNSNEIKPENLPSSVLQNQIEENPAQYTSSSDETSYSESGQNEKQQIIDALIHNKYHRGRTAKELMIDRKTLYRKMKQYKLLD